MSRSDSERSLSSGVDDGGVGYVEVTGVRRASRDAELSPVDLLKAWEESHGIK